MGFRLRKFLYAAIALVAAASLLLVAALGLERARNHASLWRQLKAAAEAFGGLIGVGLIGLCTIVLLLVVDRWMEKDRPAGDEAE